MHVRTLDTCQDQSDKFLERVSDHEPGDVQVTPCGPAEATDVNI